MNKRKWLRTFKAIYRRHTGITFGEGGGEDEEALDRYYPNHTPADAVILEMNRYGLIDVTNPFRMV